MKFLFWNVQRKHLAGEIVDLIIETGCALNAFAELEDGVVIDVIARLKKCNLEYAHFPTPGCDKIKVIAAEGTKNISLLNQHKNFSLLKISLKSQELLVGFVHLPSKLHHTIDQLRRACEVLHRQIVEEEESHKIKDTAVMGDFNVDPFEAPMISFAGMAATNGIACSQREEIICDEETKRLFYNPMWTLYSSHKERPGSHKYTRTGEDVVSWHFLDQVIIRPSLIDNFDFNSLKLIRETKNYKLTNINHKPSPSDHLPLFFELNFK